MPVEQFGPVEGFGPVERFGRAERTGPVEQAGPASTAKPPSRRGWDGDANDTHVRADYPGLLGRGSNIAGRGPRRPSDDRHQPQASEDEYLHGRILPPHSHLPSADDDWQDGRPHDGFGQGGDRPEFRYGERPRREGQRGDYGMRAGDGYGPRHGDDFGSAPGSWAGPGAYGYSPDIASGYRHGPQGDIRRAPEGDHRQADGAHWADDRRRSSGDSGHWSGDGTQWSEDGERWSDDRGRSSGDGGHWSGDGTQRSGDGTQWSGDGTQWSGDGERWSDNSRARHPGYDMPAAGFGSPSNRGYVPAPDGRYAPPPEVLHPLPELPHPEPSRPELASPDGPGRERRLPHSRLPELPSPQSSRSELVPPALPRPDQRLPELPQPEESPRTPRQPERTSSEPTRFAPEPSDGLRPEVQRLGSGPGQIAGFGGEPSRLPDAGQSDGGSLRADSAQPRPDEVPSGLAKSDGTARNLAKQDSDRDDDTITKPLPVILPGATALPRPAPVETPRGFSAGQAGWSGGEASQYHWVGRAAAG